jgi:hypothetical protein
VELLGRELKLSAGSAVALHWAIHAALALAAGYATVARALARR